MKQISTIIIVVFSFFSINVFSQTNEIFLTTTNKHGDCVSSKIYILKSDFEKRLDTKSCQNQNKGNQNAINICIENVENQTETDAIVSYCGDGIEYIGIDGKTLVLKRISKKPTEYSQFIGNYAAGNYKVQIKKIKEIAVEYFENTPKNEENIMSYSCEVLITISKGKTSKTYKGRTSEGI